MRTNARAAATIDQIGTSRSSSLKLMGFRSGMGRRSLVGRFKCVQRQVRLSLNGRRRGARSCCRRRIRRKKSGQLWWEVFLAARPAGEQECRQNGGAKDAGPKAGLGGHVSDMLATNKVVGDAPSQGPKGKEGEQKGRQSKGARTAAAGLLILDDTKRSHDDATSAFSNGAVAASLFAG